MCYMILRYIWCGFIPIMRTNRNNKNCPYCCHKANKGSQILLQLPGEYNNIEILSR